MKLQNLPNPNDYGERGRGLNVFGYKVVNGDALTTGYIAAG